jgi:hypothetical protein
MKQKIYEIPIWDAFQAENCECPLCAIEKKCDDDFISALFTEMVMDVRLNPQLVKDFDFCREHFEKLYRYPDKCGLAVLTNRILQARRENLKYTTPNKNSIKKASIKSFFSKDTIKIENDTVKECMLCNRLQQNMDNYFETLLALWCKDTDFKKLYNNSLGFCNRHFKVLMIISEILIKDTATLCDFKSATLKLQEKNMSRLQEELEWFISKFDYRFTDEPWKTSKDALIRSIHKLVGNYNSKI